MFRANASTITVLENFHYYPFGQLMEGLGNSTDTKYRYNNKEYNNEFGMNLYDYGARMYDPLLGRWNGVDPLADKYYAWSPYNYVIGNPINFIDPDGQKVVFANAAAERYVLEQIKNNKAFRKQYEILEKANNTYEFKHFERGVRYTEHGADGGIQVIDEAEGIFQIQFQLADPNHSGGLGKSELHDLYEETFHAADFEAGRSSSMISEPDSKGRKYIGHDKSDRSHEARAWKFAAENAPDVPVRILTIAGESRTEVEITNTLIQQIISARSIEEVEKLLYEPYKITVYVPSTNQEGEVEQPSLYHD